MIKPGGRVTYVDYGTKTVRVSVNRAQGVRPLMRFSIFDILVFTAAVALLSGRWSKIKSEECARAAFSGSPRN